MKSIFHKLVTKEDDFTQLLFNLMERNGDFRANVLRLLLPDAPTSTITAEQIEIQVDLRNCGRPDIELSSHNLYALIEVKVDLSCRLTENQEIEPNPAVELKGYLAALSKRGEQERRLVYLVPRQWESLPELQQSVKDQKDAHRESGIGISIEPWETIHDLFKRRDAGQHDPLVEEFIKLLAERFGPINFFGEEVQMLFSEGFVAWQTVRKLQTLIDQIGDRGKAQGYAIRTERTKDEYGVYFRNPSGSKELWFGMWFPFSEQEGMPLCFGIQNSKAKTMPTLKVALDSACKGSTKQCRGWTMNWITQEALEASDPLEAVWEQLNPTLAAVLGD